MNKVYVVAWEYNTGGGFDWYHTPEDADKAFQAEKVNCLDDNLADENWTAAMYEFLTELDPFIDSEDITTRIDSVCCELFDSAAIKFRKEAN